MASPLIRIFSDLHYGDRTTALTSLSELDPLFEGADEILLNGDTLDTRPSPNPGHTAALLAEIRAFFAGSAPPTTFLTGNHDPDLAPTHHRTLAGGAVFAIHGDALFDDLVPWSRDAPIARALLSRELAALSPAKRRQLDPLVAAVRRAAYAIPQRHQSETHGLRYLAGFLQDTVWPPSRIFRIIRAWREAPRRAEAFVTQHALPARFFAMGHTHRLGVTRTHSGLVVLNTGSFCPPCAAGAVDVTPDRVVLRRVERRRNEFRLSAEIAAFSLAPR